MRVCLMRNSNEDMIKIGHDRFLGDLERVSFFYLLFFWTWSLAIVPEGYLDCQDIMYASFSIKRQQLENLYGLRA